MALRFAAEKMFPHQTRWHLGQRMACGALLGLGLVFCALPASATIKCVDAKGKTVYQDMPCVAGARVTPIDGERNMQAKDAARAPTVAEQKEQAEALALEREAMAQKVHACELRREAEVRRQIMRHDAGDQRTADDRKRLNGILAECQALAQQQTALIKKSVAGSRGLEAGSSQARNQTEAAMVPVAPCLRELGEELSRQYALKTDAAGDMRSSADRLRLVEMQNTCDVNGSPSAAAAATTATMAAPVGDAAPAIAGTETKAAVSAGEPKPIQK